MLGFGPSIHPITFRMGRPRSREINQHRVGGPYLVKKQKRSSFSTCHIKCYLRPLQGNDLVSFGSQGGPGLLIFSLCGSSSLRALSPSDWGPCGFQESSSLHTRQDLGGHFPIQRHLDLENSSGCAEQVPSWWESGL